jgi:hypothetical protein
VAVPAARLTNRTSGPVSAARFARGLKVTGPVELVIRTGSGHINISAGDPGRVEIRGTIRGPKNGPSANDAARRLDYLVSHPPIEQNGDIIKIGHTTDAGLRREVSIHYDVVVPAETRLNAGTGSGSVTIEGIAGPVDASAGSGAITAAGIGGDVRAVAGSGEIEVRAIKGNVRLAASSGPIHAVDLAGSLRAATGTGAIEAADIGSGEVEVETCSGRIDLRNILGPVRAHSASGQIRMECVESGGRCFLETVSGNITVRLPSTAKVEIDARTVSGVIRSGRPITIRGTGKRGLPTKGKSGGAGFEITTVSGNIEIE